MYGWGIDISQREVSREREESAREGERWERVIKDMEGKREKEGYEERKR